MDGHIIASLFISLIQMDFGFRDKNAINVFEQPQAGPNGARLQPSNAVSSLITGSLQSK
jgi:hypothetical protein